MAKETSFEFPPNGHIALLVWDKVNKDWYAVLGNEDGHVQIEVVTMPTDVEIKQTAPADLCIAQHQYDGSAWKKSNLLWGYNERWAEKVVDTNADAGDDTLTTTAVPPGYVYVLTNLSVQNNNTSNTSIEVYCSDGSVNARIVVPLSTTATIADAWSGMIPLAEGDVVNALFHGCTAGDDIFIMVWGYKMKIDM